MNYLIRLLCTAQHSTAHHITSPSCFSFSCNWILILLKGDVEIYFKKSLPQLNQRDKLLGYVPVAKHLHAYKQIYENH